MKFSGLVAVAGPGASSCKYFFPSGIIGLGKEFLCDISVGQLRGIEFANLCVNKGSEIGAVAAEIFAADEYSDSRIGELPK